MTISTTVNRSGPYAGAGTTGPFTVGFRFLENTHLEVVKTSISGVDAVLSFPADYSVTGAGGTSGTVTTTAAVAVGEKLTIIRNVPFTQETDYTQSDPFPAESHEDALDKLTMAVQQLQEVSDRTLTLAVSSSGVSTTLPTPEANKVLGWNLAENALINVDAAGGGGTSLPSIAGQAGKFLSNDGSNLLWDDTASSGGGIWVNVQDYMSAAQLAGVNGTGPLVDVIDAIEAAIAECGDITWQGSMLAQRPSAGGMKAGGTVGFPAGVYMVSRTILVPPHVRLTGQSGGGFFMPRPNDASTADGNVANVRGAQILANFPAGSGPNQAGQMWVISTANWEAGGSARPAFNKCYAGAVDIDAGNVSMVPGVEIDHLWIDSVRTPATGLHIPTQIPYGGVRLIAGLLARMQSVHIEGVDHAILVNSSWGFHVQNIFGYAYLGGMMMINDVNAGKVTQVYINRDRTLDATAPRSLSNTNRLDGIAAGSLDNDSAGFPEDFTNMRIGCFVQFPNGLHVDSFTAEGWDIGKLINQAPNSALAFTNFYSEANSIAPWACVGQIGTVSGFFDFSPGSRYGFCWGLVNSFLLSGCLPRRLHVMPTVLDPNRNIQIAVAKPDLYRNLGGGKSANMITWSNDVSQGRTLANMTATAYSQTAPDGSFTAGTLTASGAGVASFVKSGANIAAITGTVVDFVNFGQDQPYCHWADFKAGTAPVTAIELTFSGGTGRTVKGVITWTAGVPALVLSGHASITGFCEALGDGWYRINVAGNCGNNTTMVASVYLGDGTTTATAGHTLYMGEHEVNPTATPLFPIYNMSATVPVSRNPGQAGQGETWECRPGINYLGEERGRIRVAANGNPYALGLDTGNVNTGTYTTWDSALQRIARSDVSNWEVVVRDGDTIVQTANNQGVVQKNKNVTVFKEGAGSNYTLNVIPTPSGTAPYIPLSGRCDWEMRNINLNMPTPNTTDTTLMGFFLLVGGSGRNNITSGFYDAVIDLKTAWSIWQQGFESSNRLHTLFSKVNILGGGVSKLHTQSATPANSKTHVSQTSVQFSAAGAVVTGGVSGYINAVDISVTGIS